MENWPTTLQINAWLGDRAATSDLAGSAKKLASDTKRRPVSQLFTSARTRPFSRGLPGGVVVTT